MRFSHRLVALLFLLPLAARAADPADADGSRLRFPSVPLVTHDPMLSIWSGADKLTDDVTRHWTHRPHSLLSLVRIDGKTYRLMGKSPADAPALPQVGVKVTPTRSVYDFEGAGVHVTFTFMTAALPDDLDVLTRPLTYLTWAVRSADGAAHEVRVFQSASLQLTVNEPAEPVQWGREEFGKLTALCGGSKAQALLGVAGDDARINWGYTYLVAQTDSAADGAQDALTGEFARTGKLPAKDDDRQPRAANDAQPTLAVTLDCGQVGAGKPVSVHAMIGYDEVYEVKYFRQNLLPYWKRDGATPDTLFQAAERDYASLTERCEKFDREFMADATKVGGEKYAALCALAYRQCLAGNGIAVDPNKQVMMFTKENTSNGDIATVDVIFPGDPMFLLLSPTLAKASLAPVLVYAASPRWKHPCAPHDLGTYPIARGTDDGGEAMPVEESGNVLILCDAISQIDGNTQFVDQWWPQLTKWAAYLEQFGLDPENQLCTDDFMGHLAHNANLSVKAIIALAAYGDMCSIRGDQENANKYLKLAKDDAAHWMQVAADGGHSRLAFDKPGTWSQKYNLVWDRILGLNVFPAEVARQEIAFYKTQLQPYGLPLDSRTKLTKTDWTLWSASMAESSADFAAFIDPICDYLTQTTARQPFVDSYYTDDLKRGGMHARPVIGGVFIKMLTDPAIWKKWAARDHGKTGVYAPLPAKPQVTEVLPSSQHAPQMWRYTTDKPAADWAKPGSDVSAWKEGPAGFGTVGTHHTDWKTDDIWIRREFTMPAGEHSNLQFYVFHDEDVEIYVNGVLAAQEPGFVSSYDTLPILPEARALLKPGEKITLAAHCHQTSGGQDIDVGLVNVAEPAGTK